jgi:hypothetical protein
VVLQPGGFLPKTIRTFIRSMPRCRAEVEDLDFMHVDGETCITLELTSPNSLGKRVVHRMRKEHLKWRRLVLAQAGTQPKAILGNQDGTLALLSGRIRFLKPRLKPLSNHIFAS